VITIASPLRASALTLGSAADTMVSLDGLASDTESPLASLTIDGAEQLPAGGSQSEPFSVPTTSRWGLNVVRIVATDACGNTSKVVHPYLRSGAYGPALTEASAAGQVSGGVIVHLGPAALDDGNRADRDDLATELAVALDPIDLSLVIPSVLYVEATPRCSLRADDWTSTKVTRGSISGPGATHILSLQVAAGTLGLWARLDAISVTLDIEVRTCSQGTLSIANHTAQFGVSVVDAIANLPTMIAGGHVHVVAPAPTVNSTGLSMSCLRLPQSLCDLLVDFIAPFLATTIEEALDLQIRSELVPLLELSLDSTAIPSRIAAPPPIGSTSTVSTVIDGVASGAPLGGAIELSLATQVYPSARGAGVPPTAPGPAMKGGVVTPFTNSAPLGIGLRDDFVNQALWSAWYAGGFDFSNLASAAAALGLPAESLSGSAKLPPVLMPGTSGSEVELGLGDLELDGTLDLAKVLGAPHQGMVALRALATARVHGPIDYDGARQKLRFDATSTSVDVEIASALAPGITAALEPRLAQFVEGWLPPVLEALVAAIRLPSLTLPSLEAEGVELALSGPGSSQRSVSGTRLVGGFQERARCGDGLLRGTEHCDDGNGLLGDGCNDACEIEAGFACSGEPSACSAIDTDGDTVPDQTDNCVLAANADQQDTGGLGVNGPPDGIGDACQCGDVSGDGRITLSDAVIVQRSLLQPPTATPAKPALCDVGGNAGCTLSDAVILRRALLQPPTATISQACVAAVP